jgi:hypothetical protein
MSSGPRFAGSNSYLNQTWLLHVHRFLPSLLRIHRDSLESLSVKHIGHTLQILWTQLRDNKYETGRISTTPFLQITERYNCLKGAEVALSA